jgi:hypothetical protein
LYDGAEYILPFKSVVCWLPMLAPPAVLPLAGRTLLIDGQPISTPGWQLAAAKAY